MWAIFLLVVAVGVLDLLSTTVANVAAPTIMRDLGASWSPAPWLGASYTHGIIATSMPVRSRIASHGRVVVSIGVLLFAVGIVGMSGILPGLLLVLALTAACPDGHPAASAPGSTRSLSLPRFRKASAHSYP
ncbi:hypothetical protein [Microbispora rosea]|uniref:hypothetical protein n=1 Tax=Microbispora rosea TaxID=58117 RepID=UPI0009709A48|nr:hypothetical protein [Microbispora rosea]